MDEWERPTPKPDKMIGLVDLKGKCSFNKLGIDDETRLPNNS